MASMLFAASLDEVAWDDDRRAERIAARSRSSNSRNSIASHDRIIACWAMGLTQHKHAVATIQELVNLLLMRGSIGKPGAGLCPVRGHSNVQGDRTMGISEARRRGSSTHSARSSTSPRRAHHGFDTVEAIRAMRDGRAKVFFALGGNFLSATPDTEVTAAGAARTAGSRLHVSIKLNRSHLVTGRTALILPCSGPHRARHAERARAVRHHRELDGRGAVVARVRSRPRRRIS